MKISYAFIVNFRGGTYCTEVEAESVKSSLKEWLKKLVSQKLEIKPLGQKTILEITDEIDNGDNEPLLLKGLTNTWYTLLSSNQGSFEIYIIKTGN